MITLRGKHLELTMREDGTEVVLRDRCRNVGWLLDESTRLASRGVGRFEHAPYADQARNHPQETKVQRLAGGRLLLADERSARFVHPSPAGEVEIHWILEDDRVRVIASASGEQGATALTLPGVFRPENEPTFISAIPKGQGVLHTGNGPPFVLPLFWRGQGFTLAMFGQIAGKAALVTVAETDADATLWWEKTERGRVDVMWLQHPSLGRLSYSRETVIAPCDPDLTSICKWYRRYEQAHGRFKTWAEKIAERPSLEKLFGAAIIFVGYHQDPELDYAASFRRLRAAGIDRAYVYPVYLDTTMDLRETMGVAPIDIRSQTPLLEELGYLAGSFIYIMDGPAEAGADPYRNLLLDAQGKPRLLWQIRDLKWHALSSPKQFDNARVLIDREHRGLHGLHYDVLCNVEAREDYNPHSRADARVDLETRRRMLRYATERGLIVSAEGFWGRATADYDLGNGNKFSIPLCGDEYCIVPMTMLVYHDSAFHTWWEVENYNNPEHRHQFDRGLSRRFPLAGGYPQLQSAMDAIMGTPPDLFPFGLQYNFVPHHYPQIYTYKVRLEDPLVQEALEPARRVMALHRRIGKLEMIAHKLHHPDGAVQESVFADGTRVIANFANVALEVDGIGPLPAESWRVIE